eukprot:836709-Heterocapsa_arctica.AAC.1
MLRRVPRGASMRQEPAAPVPRARGLGRPGALLAGRHPRQSRQLRRADTALAHLTVDARGELLMCQPCG